LAHPAPVAARLLAADAPLLEYRDRNAAARQEVRGRAADDAAADDCDVHNRRQPVLGRVPGELVRIAGVDLRLAAHDRLRHGSLHASEIAPIRAATIAPLFRAAAPLLEFRLARKPATITITGAAGHIGYALAFRVASGQMLGADRPVNLQLLEITPALPSLTGVVMELADCAFPTLNRIVATDDPKAAFKDSDYAMLVGARPRGPGMERKDLLLANAQIFSAQGRAINDAASRDVRVLVVGNPANTNSLIAASNAPDIDRRNFTAMTRLDHNRALAQLAAK